MSTSTKQEELESLRARIEAIESELASNLRPQAELSRDYPMYYATGGFLLGLLAATVSLLFNVIGSLIANKDPMELIRIYLTFPLGDKALQLVEGAGTGKYAVPDSVILAMGCCLYLGTGMLLGIPVSLAIRKFAGSAGLIARLITGSVVALVIWAVNFYAILSWLQPALFGGRWITDGTLLPWWVAAATHVVFGATVGALYTMIQDRPSANA
ncbi:MAG: hypothetical protein U0794_12200 [Isosphaeraceae bacterium]